MKLKLILSICLIINASCIKADDGTDANNQNEETTTISDDSETTTVDSTTESKELLETDLVVLENMAIQYLPQKLNFENVIEAYRLILDDGVRYEIIVNTTKVNQTNEIELCHLVVIEKPWLITVWNEKLRELKETNCSTVDQVQNTPQIILNKKYEMNTIFDIHTPDIKSDQLDVIESQILQANKKPIGWKKENKNSNENNKNKNIIIENVNKASSIQTDVIAGKPNDNNVDNFDIEPIIVKEIKDEVIVKEIVNEKKIPNEENNDNLKLGNVGATTVPTMTTTPIATTTNGLSEDNKNYLDNFFKYFDFNDNITNNNNNNENNLNNSNSNSNLNDNKNNEDDNLQRAIDFQQEIKLDDQTSMRKKRSTYNDNIKLDDEKHIRLFNKFQLKFSRKYESALEKQIRYRIFKNNLIKINELNKMELGTGKYGVTEFSDLTAAEYKMRTGLVLSSDSNDIKNPIADIPNFKLPKSFDWRKHGAVSEVKQQGTCGSCWAFSVTGNIEGLHAIKTGKLEEYSEQELLDCDTDDDACNGGDMDHAYKAIERIGGLELETDYPYEARQKNCHFNNTKVHVQVKGGIDLPKNETAMALWLVANGPISIAINSNAMQFYRSGISHPWKFLCRHNSIDHGVLIVGFGVAEYPLFNKTLPYWIVKNSWGPTWGEKGYYRVYRGDNTCGLTSEASSAVLQD